MEYDNREHFLAIGVAPYCPTSTKLSTSGSLPRSSSSSGGSSCFAMAISPPTTLRIATTSATPALGESERETPTANGWRNSLSRWSTARG